MTYAHNLARCYRLEDLILKKLANDLVNNKRYDRDDMTILRIVAGLKTYYQAKGSPDQPRDDHGRWTSGGGSGSLNGETNETVNGSSDDVPSNADASDDNPQQTGDDGSFDVAGSGGTPKTNTVQNKQFKDACKGLGMTKDDMKELHKEIHGLNLGFHEIRERAKCNMGL